MTPTGPGGTPVPEAARVRPYALVAGRTQAAAALAVEAVLQTSRAAEAAQRSLEAERILLRCVRPCGLAELAAHLALPLGVVRVLVGDLVDEGLLHLHRPGLDLDDPRERALLERVLAGLEVL